MHPFWVVRRLTAKQLGKERLEPQGGKLVPRFNCKTTTRSLSNVCVSAIEGYAQNRSRIFDVPFLTNFEQLQAGEELIMEIIEKRKEASSTKRSWRDIVREEDREKEEGIESHETSGEYYLIQ